MPNLLPKKRAPTIPTRDCQVKLREIPRVTLSVVRRRPLLLRGRREGRRWQEEGAASCADRPRTEGLDTAPRSLMWSWTGPVSIGCTRLSRGTHARPRRSTSSGSYTPSRGSTVSRPNSTSMGAAQMRSQDQAVTTVAAAGGSSFAVAGGSQGNAAMLMLSKCTGRPSAISERS